MTAEYIPTQPKSWVPLAPAMKMVFAIGLNEIDRLQVIDDIEAKLRELNEIKESVMTAQTEIINRAKLELVLDALMPFEKLFRQDEAMQEAGKFNGNVHCQVARSDLRAALYAAGFIKEALAKPEQKLVTWPEPMEHPPIYSDEDPEEQVRATRYRTGWNDCLAKCKSATTSSINQQP